MLQIFLILLFSTLALAEEPVLLLYNHAECPENCLIYDLLVRRDGQVQMMGREGAVRKGRFQATIPLDTVQAWEELLASAKLFDKPTNYTHSERKEKASSLEYFTPEGHGIRHRIKNVESPELDLLEPRLQALLGRLDWQTLENPVD